MAPTGFHQAFPGASGDAGTARNRRAYPVPETVMNLNLATLPLPLPPAANPAATLRRRRRFATWTSTAAP